MMATSKIPSYEKISQAEFHEILKLYPEFIETLSKSKPVKSGHKTLQELDEYRFVTAPNTFGGPAPKQSMKQQDVETLVQWKLRHGKFRPTLMSLVSSNPPDLTSHTIASALQTYMPPPQGHRSPYPPSTDAILAALLALSKLRGIGPATASLLLAVHDAPNVVFFSDEAFQWLCGDGGEVETGTGNAKRKIKMKYDMVEYRGLCERARALARRLDVTPAEIEKVAYVLVRRQLEEGTGTGIGIEGESGREGKTKDGKRKAKGEVGDAPEKKKVVIKGEEKGREEAPVRRSKRLKK